MGLTGNPPRGRSSRRGNEFSQNVIIALAKRAGYQCSICSALTVAASSVSDEAVTNIGVAAHIAAASPGGSRYDCLMTSAERSSIQNAIWLCQNHAKEIDDDAAAWPKAKLYKAKNEHERTARSAMGVPRRKMKQPAAAGLVSQEYAFVRVGELESAYKMFIDPILKDRGLGDDSELGILMVGSPNNEATDGARETPWTTFVDPAWLRWALEGQRAAFDLAKKVPSNRIYGRVPGWPDDFWEFLQAIVQTGTTFSWTRGRAGHLILGQRSSSLITPGPMAASQR